MNTTTIRGLLSLLLAGAAFGSILFGFDSAQAHAWLGECTVNFDNKFALTNAYDQAKTTFAVKTAISPSGDLVLCDPAVHSACWDYRHRCFNDYINVWPPTYGHFHLSFEDPTITCFAEGGFGRMVGDDCVAADWEKEPRILQSHDQDEWIQIWLEDRVTHDKTVFDMTRIRVGGDKAIQFWFKKTDGSWWFWEQLDPGYNWKIEDWVYDVKEVWIKGTNSGLGAYTIKSFIVLD